MGEELSRPVVVDQTRIRSLKIEEYPINLAEDRWVPIEFKQASKQNLEALTTKTVDRRIRAKPEDYAWHKCDDEKQENKATNSIHKLFNASIKLSRCVCGKSFQRILAKNCYYGTYVACVLCEKCIKPNEFAYHCPEGKTKIHKDGYDLCVICKDKRISKHLNDDDKKTNDSNSEILPNPIYNIVQLRIKYTDPNTYSYTNYKVCSGVIIHHTLNKAFVLTAAQNVVQSETIWIQMNRNTANGYQTVKLYKCCKYYVSEQAVAVVEVLDPYNQLKKTEPVQIEQINNAKDFVKVNVIGYPNEMELRGQLYGLIGHGRAQNGLLNYNNIDTLSGNVQAGSPIFECVHDIHTGNIFKSFAKNKIVGIHLADSGKMITGEIMKWLHKYTGITSDDDSLSYDISVLLITSSKAKYSYRLNQIYVKCNKTQIMDTMQLYFEYDDDQNAAVNKQEFLFYVKKMFAEQRKTYLIFYCGQSDENGNWKINNNTIDNITLHDVSLCAQQKADYEPDCKVCIVSDCNQSGNWVQRFRRNRNEFKNIDAIQASSQRSEVCNAGTFTSKYAHCCFAHQSKEWETINTVGVTVGALGVLTVGVFYDGFFKQPYHHVTKQSQPTSTETKGNPDKWIIGYSRGRRYKVQLCFYDSWYDMDFDMTFVGGAAVGTVGEWGFF